jgi:HAE1 family hydrophobic/amphiphilic exporter-1
VSEPNSNEPASPTGPAPQAEDGSTGSAFYDGLVARPVAVAMAFLAAIVFGQVSYGRLPIELMPDLAYPTLTVRTAWDGAAPEEIESEISEPVEQALATLDGLVSIQSRSRAGSSDVVLGFDWGTDMDDAAQTIRESLQTTFLPDGAERPLLLRYDPSLDPILRIAIAWSPDFDVGDPDRALRNLREIAEDQVQRELEAMDGVAAARVRGGLEREIQVLVREDWLAARRLSLSDVQSALAAENVNLAGGSVYEGDTEYLVRTLNELTGVDDIRELRIRRSDGVQVPITDVAEISETHKKREVVTRLDGRDAVEIEVFSEADANLVVVAAAVKEALFGDDHATEGASTKGTEKKDDKSDTPEAAWGPPESEGLAADLPEGVVLKVLDDQAAFVEEAITNLTDTAVQGGLLSIIVLYLFLRDWRATAIIGATIPLSVIIGFAPLHLWGVSLNLMSLGGLALGLGMLVDNAVVVLESVQRYRELGWPRQAAAARGTSEVAAAVFASTMTSVAVFLPLSLIDGVGGQVFNDLGLAVVGSQLASLGVALLLVPVLVAVDPFEDLGGDDEDHGLSAMAAAWATHGVRGVASLALRQLRDAWRAERIETGVWFRWAIVRPWRWPLIPLWLPIRFLSGVTWEGLVPLAQFMTVGGARVGLAMGWLFLTPLARGADWIAAAFNRSYDRGAARFLVYVTGVLKRPFAVLTTALALFIAALWVSPLLGSELMPIVHQGRFVIDTRLPVGTPLEATERLVARAEALVADDPDVASVYAVIGSDGRAEAAADEGSHSARLRVQLAPGGDLAAREDVVQQRLRAALAEIPRLEVRFSRPSLFAISTPVELVLFGDDLDDLRRTSDAVLAAAADDDRLVDVRSSLGRGHPEIRVSYDRVQLQRFGLDTNTVATRIRDRVQGVVATEIHRADQRLDLRVQLGAADRSSVQDIRGLNINPNHVPVVPLEAVSSITEAVGPSEVRRVDQRRAVVVSAEARGFDLAGTADSLATLTRRVSLPDGMIWEIGGQSKLMDESYRGMMFALGLAVFLVYAVMASTFEHVMHPLVILFSVPLSASGVVLGLMIANTPVSVVVFLGVIILAGVVVNNAIVLVDAINRLREEGLEREHAIAEACKLRLRPILVTTAASVLGLLPLALGFGAGAEMQQPLAITVMGGLSSSTLLTLVVIPCIYAIVTRRSA